MPLQTSALALGSASSKLFTTGDTIAFCNNGSKSCLLNHINFSRHSHKSHCKRRCSVYASSRVSDTQHSGLVQDSAPSAEALQDARVCSIFQFLVMCFAWLVVCVFEFVTLYWVLSFFDVFGFCVLYGMRVCVRRTPFASWNDRTQPHVLRAMFLNGSHQR